MAKWIDSFDVRDIWKQAKDKEMTAAQLSREIADRIDNKSWLWTIKPQHIQDALCKFAEIEDASFDAFDIIWEQFYNWADAHRVWIKTGAWM